MRVFSVVVLSLLASAPWCQSDESVDTIRKRHDRALIADLRAYLESHRDASDRDRAYLMIFETAVEHDWFAETEGLASAYLASEPRGEVAPMARIVTTMARAKAGDLGSAIGSFRLLLAGLDDERQVAFAADFAQSLAAEAIAAGETDLAARVHEALLEKYGSDPDLRADVTRWQERLKLVGQPAPEFEIEDVDGRVIRLADLRGKPVLLDFWATWCEPAIADRPALQAAYEAHRGAGLEVISVSLDDEAEAVRKAVREGGWGWRQVHAATAGLDLVELYRVGQVPASVLIGADGRIERLDLKGRALGELMVRRQSR